MPATCREAQVQARAEAWLRRATADAKDLPPQVQERWCVSFEEARETADKDTAECRRFLLRPNRSLTTNGMLALFGAVTLIAAVFATGFALAGAWWVAPFAGLETAAVGAVLYLLHRHAGDGECIEIEGRRVRIVRTCGARRERHEFERYWTRARLAPGAGWQPSRLTLGSHGRHVEVGAWLNEDERRRLAGRLIQLLGPAAA